MLQTSDRVDPKELQEGFWVSESSIDDPLRALLAFDRFLVGGVRD